MSPWGHAPSHQFEESIFHILIPQAVDDRVEEGCGNVIEKGHFLATIWQRIRARAHVCDDAWNSKYGNHSDVGGTGRESLYLPLGWADLHDGGKDVDIDKDNQGEWDHNDIEASDEVHQVIEGCVCTGQLQDRRDLTEVVVNFIRATVGKVHSKEGISQATHHTIGCTDAHHEKAQPVAHDDLISERVADGHVPVHRHDGEKPGLSDPKEEEDVHLGHTSSKRDGSLLAENVLEHLGHCRGGVAHVQ